MSTVSEVRNDAQGQLRCWAWAVGSAMVGTLTVWAVSRLGDVDLIVKQGDTTRAVGWPSVLVASAVAALAGMLLLRLLQRRSGERRGRTIWTVVAVVVFLVSLLLGPLSATTATGAICLSIMHLVVLVALAGSAWRR
jgi:cytochrome bd-type quinol oxidase subunit 2